MSRIVLQSLLLLALLVSSTIAHPSESRDYGQNRNHVPSIWKRDIGAPGPGNITATDSITADDGIAQVHCSGESNRTALNLRSCADALGQIPQSHDVLRFQMRGQGAYDVALPHRFISADGKCILELILKDDVKIELATYHEIWIAARRLLYQCVMPSSVGGIALDIGTGSGLGMIMTSYNPRVQCRREDIPPPNDHCNKFLDYMNTSPIEKFFINVNDRHARPTDIKLPRYMYESSGKCLGIIQTIEGEDQSSWYEIWEAVQAVIGVCLRFGQWGMAIKRGTKGLLYIDLKPYKPSSGEIESA